jgi:cell division protein FtsI/penicillin-binding protein 2
MDSGRPQRMAIYDRLGAPLAKQTEAAAIGVKPDFVNLAQDGKLISRLAEASNRRYDTIVSWIEAALPGAYIPIAELPVEGSERLITAIESWNPTVVQRYTRRLYYGGGIAPHAIGYVSSIQKEEADFYRRKGYRIDERVGRKGIELWGEDILMGKRGGTLYVFTKDGVPTLPLGTLPSEPGQDIYTTFESDFQYQAQKAMSIYNGAAVVLERDTGRVLAMVSTPGFDPNAYEPDNYNWLTLLDQIGRNPYTPQYNRASQGQYPLGSVFKIITMAASLEQKRINADYTFDCQYTFEEVGGVVLYDWTWEHFQEDGETQPTGLINTRQALMKSCNPFFWHLGLDLYRQGLSTAVSDMSKAFGLGSKTGIEGVAEEAGNIPTPGSELDATNLAIGQGDMQVTPLQVARFIAAMGNGGTLYRPQLIEKIVRPDGTVTFEFQPEAQGTLPLTPENLKLIQEAMLGVVRSTKPRGTAWKPLNSLNFDVAGKTGTATSSSGKPHAWFAGYTFEGRQDKPDIVVVVIAENAGEGSEVAAPIFRRIVEIYFLGQPQRLYPWEATFDVTKSPTPLYTNTPEGATPGPGGINP